MSNAVLTRVWTQSKQIKNHRLLLVALADGVNDHGVGFHGLRYLSEKVLLSERQTKRLKDDLESWGEIYVRNGNGRGKETLYLVCTGLDESQITFALETHFEMEPENAKNVTLSIVEKRVTFLNERVTKSNIKGDKKREKGDMVKRKSRTTINHKNHSNLLRKPKVSENDIKPKKTHIDQPLKDAVAQHIQKIPINEAGGLTGTLAQKIAGVWRKRLGVDILTAEHYAAIARSVPIFVQWFTTVCCPGMSLPINPDKLENHYAAMPIDWRPGHGDMSDLVDDPEHPGSKITPGQLRSRQAQQKNWEALYGNKTA
jgi:hypothetical protein